MSVLAILRESRPPITGCVQGRVSGVSHDHCQAWPVPRSLIASILRLAR
jgi:hypothetical protein